MRQAQTTSSHSLSTDIDDDDLDLTPNDRDDTKTRIRKAIAFVDKTGERPGTAASIYKVHLTSVCSALKRPKNRQYGGQNKIL